MNLTQHQSSPNGAASQTNFPSVTDSERAEYVRRLRFPLDLERTFQADYYRKSLKSMRLGLTVAVVLVIAVSIHLYAQGVFADRIAVAAFVFLALTLGLTYRPSFEKFWKPYLFVAAAAGTLYILTADMLAFAGSGAYPTVASKLAIIGLEQSIMMVGFVVMVRLPFFWTMAMLAVVEGGMAAVSAQLLSPAPEALGNYVMKTMFVLIFLMLATLALERYHRADFLTNRLLDAERSKSEKLLLNILPGPIAERLKASPDAIAESYGDVSVLFADIVGFTTLSARLPAPKVVQLLNDVFSAFDAFAEKHGLEKIKTIGDASMAVGNLPLPREGHLEAMAEMALEMQAAIKSFRRETGEPLSLRVGIHSGPVVAGVIGTKKFMYDLWGDTVNIASRMESHGSPGVIQVTAPAWERLRDSYAFGPSQQLEIKGRGLMTSYHLLGHKTDDC